MPVRHRELGDELAPPEPKRCRHCDESRSSCGESGGTEGSEGRASWRVTLDHDLVETLSAIYPEWFKQPRRERSRAASPLSPVSPTTPQTPLENDLFSSGAEEMASGSASGSGASEPASSPPRVSPPKVVVDDSPLRPAMGRHKESLKVKLMMRRPRNLLVAQGIMPPLKTPPAFFKQRTQLERAKTGDLLKAKIQSRPDRHELERRHILEQESHLDPSLAEKQRMLKKARLADQLSDQLLHRPGPLELIKKNILHTEETIETAVKSGILAFKATSEGDTRRPEHPSSYCGPNDEVSPSPSPPSTLSPASVASPQQHPAPGKDSHRRKLKHSRHKCDKNDQFKNNMTSKPLKFHEYKPPNSQKSAIQTPYELLIQQQQLLLQMMLPASPAPSSAASVASDSSDAISAAPQSLPSTPTSSLSIAGSIASGRFEDMKVSDLRAECKRRNLRVSGPKPQLIDRLRPYFLEMQEESPRSPVSVASPESKGESEPSEDIVQSQRRLIEELERQLEESRQQLEAVRREAAGAVANAAASDQGRRLLQAHLSVTQLRAKLDALQQIPTPAPAPRYVIAAPDHVRLYTVTPPSNSVDLGTDIPSKATNSAYILNGVKVVPIAILPSTFEPERVPPPPPPPPPPMPSLLQTPLNSSLHNNSEHNAEDSQIMDDVLEILAKNGEYHSSVDEINPNQSLDAGYLTGSNEFTSSDVLTDEMLREPHVRDTLDADELQRDLHEILSNTDLNSVNNRCQVDPVVDIDTDLSMDMLAHNEYNAHFGNSSPENHDDLIGRLLGTNVETAHHDTMDIDDDMPERMSMTPLTNGDNILDHTRTGFDDMTELSLPLLQTEDLRQNAYEEPCDFDFKHFDIDSNMNVDGDTYDYLNTINPEPIPNLFGRGHIPQCDPVLGGVVSRPAPRPAHKHLSWDRIEYDAT